MADLDLTERHYAKVEGFVRRTAADITPTARANRFSALHFLDDVRDPIPGHPRLISSAHGGIAEVLFTTPAYAVLPPRGGLPNPLAQVYRDLLTKLPAAAKLIVMTREDVQETVSQWLRAADIGENTTVVSVPGHLHFSIWAEDGYVVVQDQDSGKRYPLEPFLLPRYGDGLIADFVSNETDLLSNQAPLHRVKGPLPLQRAEQDHGVVGPHRPDVRPHSCRVKGRVTCVDMCNVKETAEK
jgi:hypothetical protein